MTASRAADTIPLNGSLSELGINLPRFAYGFASGFSGQMATWHWHEKKIVGCTSRFVPEIHYNSVNRTLERDKWSIFLHFLLFPQFLHLSKGPSCEMIRPCSHLRVTTRTYAPIADRRFVSAPEAVPDAVPFSQ